MEVISMKIVPVSDPSFAPYGRIVEGYDVAGILKALEETTPCPDSVVYFPKVDSLHAVPGADEFGEALYGGMPFQLGCCNGHNTKHNCLEYHRDSEVNIGEGDFILLLAKAEDIVDDKLDTAKVKAFRAPAGAAVEVYETSLHYAPCQVDGSGFRVAVVLPRGTNTYMPAIRPQNEEDKWLWARNKWLLAHPESSEAKAGAYVGLTGENIDIG